MAQNIKAQTGVARRWRGTLTATASATLLVIGLNTTPANAATSILFIGNSFTYGALASVETFRTGSVTDLNGTGIGGVPALFKAFTQQAGLDYTVSLETQPGSGLDFHWDNRLALIDKPWDKVVMHGQSNLDFGNPGNPAKVIQYSKLLSEAFHAQNANVDVSVTATWSRADLTYQTASPWLGGPITQMAIDVQAGYDAAKLANGSLIDRVNPVGLAWNRAMNVGVADTNPYNGIDAGKLNLWASDSYHASNYGYYLHALTVFGMVTGVDPRSLGGSENAAAELGFSASEAYALQSIAFEQIQAVPEPSTWLLMGLGIGGIGFVCWKAKQAA